MESAVTVICGAARGHTVARRLHGCVVRLHSLESLVYNTEYGWWQVKCTHGSDARSAGTELAGRLAAALQHLSTGTIKNIVVLEYYVLLSYK